MIITVGARDFGMWLHKDSFSVSKVTEKLTVMLEKLGALLKCFSSFFKVFSKTLYIKEERGIHTASTLKEGNRK